MNSAPIFWVVATRAEALPLIEHFDLKAIKREAPYPVWQSEDMALVVSGIGKTTCAAATAYLYACEGQPLDVLWVNFGLAGNRDLEVGSGGWAARITEDGSKKVYYPTLWFAQPREMTYQLSLHTVAKPQRRFPNILTFDMEASGFFEIATKFSPPECVQSYKVISDNAANPLDEIPTRSQVYHWCQPHLQELEQLVDAWRQLERPEFGESEELYHQLQERYHFSSTQSHQLRHLLQGAESSNVIFTEKLLHQPSSRKVIEKLENELVEKKIEFSR